MGSFYTSHIVRGPSQSQVLAWLNDRPAYVSVTQGGTTVVLDAACESQDGEELAELAAGLSAQLSVLCLRSSTTTTTFFTTSCTRAARRPTSTTPVPATSEKESQKLALLVVTLPVLPKAFGVTDSAPIEAALRNPDYVFAMERHRDLAAALGLPEFSVGLGYTYAEAGEFPPGTPPDAYTHSGAREG